MKSFAFVTIQFSCLAYFALTGSFILFDTPYIIIQALGASIIMWAIITMNPRQWTIFPEPKKLGNLVVSGPYRWVRHPMYSGLLMLTLAIGLFRMDWPSVLVITGFLINQIQKLKYEEAMLIDRFSEYNDYMKSTKRLVPYLY